MGLLSMIDVLDVFHFDLYNIATCPNCEHKALSITSATNKSVKISCSNCSREWFYRRVEL